MLDQLVESRSIAGENTRRGSFLFTTAIIMFSLLLGTWMYSLFAHDYGMGGGDLELSSLVAPVPVPAEAPPPEPEQKPEKQQTADKTPVDMPMRTANIARTDEPVIPDKVSSAPSSVKARPQGRFIVGDKNTETSGNTGNVRDTSGTNGSSLIPSKPLVEEKDEEQPPQLAPKPTPTPKPIPRIVSQGVINGKALKLVQPPYPAPAKAVHASGAVNVQVSIDTNGNVVSASAVSGHPLLRSAAEQAARASKFSPTVLSGQPVSVTGVIVYNFVAQ